VKPSVHPPEIALEVCFVGSPRQPVHAGRGILLEFIERRFEMFDAEMVEERSELLLLPFACCFPYAFQRLGHAYPALCPVPCFAGAHSPWSPPLAPPAPQRIAPLRRLSSYYGGVRLLTRVHHRLRLLAFPMRTAVQVQAVARETSRFPPKERLHVPGSLTTRDWIGPRDIASIHVAFRTQYGVSIPI
jgi:hypothetical protein